MKFRPASKEISPVPDIRRFLSPRITVKDSGIYKYKLTRKSLDPPTWLAPTVEINPLDGEVKPFEINTDSAENLAPIASLPLPSHRKRTNTKPLMDFAVKKDVKAILDNNAGKTNTHTDMVKQKQTEIIISGINKTFALSKIDHTKVDLYRHIQNQKLAKGVFNLAPDKLKRFHLKKKKQLQLESDKFERLEEEVPVVTDYRRMGQFVYALNKPISTNSNYQQFVFNENNTPSARSHQRVGGVMRPKSARVSYENSHKFMVKEKEQSEVNSLLTKVNIAKEQSVNSTSEIRPKSSKFQRKSPVTSTPSIKSKFVSNSSSAITKKFKKFIGAQFLVQDVDFVETSDFVTAQKIAL